MILILIAAICTIINFNDMMDPHWAHQIAKQESLLKRLISGTNNDEERRKKYYSNLDTDEPAREMPVYVGR